MGNFNIKSDPNEDIGIYIYQPKKPDEENPNDFGNMFKCVVAEPVVWTTEQKYTPSKLEFTVIKHTAGDALSFNEGAVVIFIYKGKEVFRGRIFTKQRDKNHHIACTAYDTLRYLKNSVSPREFKMHEGTTTTKILEHLCGVKDTAFIKGDFATTDVNVVWNEVSPKTGFDIIAEAAEQTRVNDKKHTIYTLYDEGGKLYYKSQEDMKLDPALIINSDSLENFSYTTSIDEDTYNRVLLYWGDDEGSTKTTKKTTDEKRMPAGAWAEQSENLIYSWGLLQKTEKIDSTTFHYKDMAKKLLETYNRKTRTLTLQGCFGDVRARAGTSVILNLDLGDLAGGRYAFVTKARHSFEHKFHSMDLDVEILDPSEVIKLND